ncbi:site-specific integrase [Cytobacillus kochii]|uniref:tyrosine-type recombinase/integrase n=1 Tax=Cytobacillus kochii TaxID=859143 RepID=UPI001CD7090F|nr:site-specific integrase [Cytobacillus kochii]MCA1027000.1 site-specific integrase [Cytobacillus kochii]
MLQKNIVKLSNTLIYDQIKKYLETHGYNSKETRRAYELDIRKFFGIVKDKEIEYLTKEDIQITLDDFEDYISHLYNLTKTNGEKKLANSSINRKVKGVKGLIKYLAAKKLIDDISYLSLIKTLPEIQKHHGILEFDEVLEYAEAARLEKHNGNIKRLAILFAFDTCARISDVTNIKWSNFMEKDDVVLVRGIGKGNKEFKESIDKEFFKELKTLKQTDSEKVFNIDNRRLTDMMIRLNKKLGIQEERNIKFHSLRKAGATWRYRVTGDILEAKRSLNHSSLANTQRYLATEDYGILGAVSSGGKIDNELFKNVDLETLTGAIESCPKNVQMIINMKLQQMNN